MENYNVICSLKCDIQVIDIFCGSVRKPWVELTEKAMSKIKPRIWLDRNQFEGWV